MLGIFYVYVFNRNIAFSSLILQIRFCYDIIDNDAACVVGAAKNDHSIRSAVWQSIFCIERRKLMSVSYKKLWKLLIDKEMKKKELCAKAGISTSSLTKMGKNGHVTTEVLAKICRALGCTVDDIMEVIPE